MSSYKIGIVMGGYLDENNKLMDRIELNKRIALAQAEIAELIKNHKADLNYMHKLADNLQEKLRLERDSGDELLRFVMDYMDNESLVAALAMEKYRTRQSERGEL